MRPRSRSSPPLRPGHGPSRPGRGGSRSTRPSPTRTAGRGAGGGGKCAGCRPGSPRTHRRHTASRGRTPRSWRSPRRSTCRRSGRSRDFVAANPMNTVCVLLVEDSASDAELMLRALRGAGLEPVHERVDNPEAMRQALKRQSWDVVLSDYSMPAFDAPAALVLLQQHSEDIPFIVVSGSVGEDTAVAVMKAGAVDYVMKDRLARLAPAVTRAIDGARLRRDRRRLEQQLQEAQKLEAVGKLAGGVAHDFNNVLTAILGSAELLLLDSPPGAPTREELHIIRDAATRAQDLIRQLLAFSARQVLQPVVLDLNHLVKNVGKMLRRLIGEDIKLVSDLAPELAAVLFFFSSRRRHTILTCDWSSDVCSSD